MSETRISLRVVAGMLGFVWIFIPMWQLLTEGSYNVRCHEETGDAIVLMLIMGMLSLGASLLDWLNDK